MTTKEINHQLELSIAVELLTSRVDTALEMFKINPEWQSVGDWEETLKACAFIDKVKGKRHYMIFANDIEHYLNQ